MLTWIRKDLFKKTTVIVFGVALGLYYYLSYYFHLPYLLAGSVETDDASDWVTVEEQVDQTVKELLQEKQELQERLKEINLLLSGVSLEIQQSEAEKTNGFKIRRKDWDLADERQKRINFVYEQTGGDWDLLLTFTSENSAWVQDLQSYVPGNGPNGREPSYGFCQIHHPSHPDIVNDQRFWNDPYWQLERCIELYYAKTPMYGFKSRWEKFYLFEEV